MNSFERKPSSPDRLALTAGKLHLELSPATGGAISEFTWVVGGHARPILRQVDRDLKSALDACSFPLVPYVNRIRGGSFHFRGRDVQLKPNMAGDPSPLHGQGWLNSWTVESAGERQAMLSYRHQPGEWPWSYEARQEVELDENGLTMVLTCRNLSDEPMPCGLGQHPYFPCGANTKLSTDVAVAWTVDDRVLPVAKVPAEGRYDLKDRLVCGQGLDNGFGEWGGAAHMTDPDWPFELRLSSEDAEYFQLYSPPDGGIFVAEPVTHANAALNAPEKQWSELGIKVLQTNEAMHLRMRIEIIERERGG